MSSENPSGADNQQETATSMSRETVLAGSSETARQARILPEAVKIQSDLHGDMQSQAEMPWPLCNSVQGNTMPKVAKFLVG
jgi:hypothetical protein